MYNKHNALITLVLIMTLLTAGGVFASVLDRRIDNGDDDAEQLVGGAIRDIGSSDLELAFEDVNQGDPQVIGVRFQDIQIPQGAPIMSAYVQFQVDETRGGTEPVNLLIDGELTADAADFVVNDEIVARLRTTAEVSWAVPDWDTNNQQGPDQQTPDLTAIIQEIINQPGWMPGNAIALIFSDNPANPSLGVRCAESRDGSTSGAPLLHIEFSAGGASQPQPADGAIIDYQSVELLWSGGDFAETSRVFFGDNSANVEAGINGADKGIIYWTGYPVSGLAPGTTYYWRIEEVNDLHPSSPWEGEIWTFTTALANAAIPDPCDGAVNIHPDATLSWDPGMNMVFQYIFIGTDRNTVLNSTTPTFYSTTSSFQPTGLLDNEKTYYWRIDTYDTSGGDHKGDIWSFSTMQEILITDPDLIGWWTFEETSGQSALDWSGHDNTGDFVGDPQRVPGYDGAALDLDGDDFVIIDRVADDIDSNDITLTAWVKTSSASDFYSCNSAGGSSNIVLLGITGSGQFAVLDGFDNAYEGHSTTTVDDNQWHMLAYVRQGDTGYVYVDGALENTHTAEYDLSPDDRWSLGQEWDTANPTELLTGQLDDVRMYNKSLTDVEIKKVMQIDPTRAWNPNPNQGSTVSIVDLGLLSWSAGEKAVQHDVYFGADPTAVATATRSNGLGVYMGRQSLDNFDPGELTLGSTYYWRIDEFNNDATTSIGAVWRFSTVDHIIVEDFESYGNIGTIGVPGSSIWFTWNDGFGYNNPSPGSAGNGTGSYVDLSTSIVHAGDQALIIDYDNTGNFQSAWGTSITAHHSRVDAATSNLSIGSNWNQFGIKALALWVRGYPESTGSLTMNGGNAYTVTGSGSDIWNIRYPWQDANDPYHDEFHFAYVTLPPGSHTIIARVDSIENTNVWAKAGVMMRDTLDGGSRHAQMCVTPGSGVSSQLRRDIGGPGESATIGAGTITAPHWVKLERDISGFCTGYHSDDGVVWVQVGGPNSVDMGDPFYLGLAVTSHDAAATTTAEFSNVTINGAPVTGWSNQDIGILANMPETLYVELAPAIGPPRRVQHPDIDAVNGDTFEQWNIALSEFVGLNLNNITRLSVGVGWPTDTTGNTGRIYVDDIELYAPRFLADKLTPRAADYYFDGIVDYADASIMVEDWLMTDYSTPPMVAHYTLDGNANDSSGRNFHGTLTNSPTFATGVPGFNMAIDCNGGDQYINVDANAVDMGIAGAAARTITSWVFLRTFNSAGIYEMGDGNDGEEFCLRVRSQQGQWRAQYGGTVWHEFTLDSRDRWVHFAQVYTGGHSLIYADGVLISSAALRLNTTTGKNLRIGRRNANYFDGLIDDVRIYNRALTEAEISTVIAGGPVNGMYHPVESPMNLVDPEPAGSRAVNFADFAVLVDNWNERQLWP